MTWEPDVIVEKLYAKLFEHPQWRRFQQEINFLTEIDPYRFYKFGVLPFLRTLFGVEDVKFQKDPTASDIRKVHAILGERLIGFSKDDDTRYSSYAFQLAEFGPLRIAASQFYEQLVVNQLVSRKFSKELIENNVNNDERVGGSPGASLRKILELVPNPEVAAGLQKASVVITHELFELGRKGLTFIKRAEQEETVLNLE